MAKVKDKAFKSKDKNIKRKLTRKNLILKHKSWAESLNLDTKEQLQSTQKRLGFS